jgi:hypothetical protein
MNWLQEFLRRQREADIYSEMPIDTYQSYSPYSPVRSLGNTGPRPRMSRPMPAARQFIPGDAGTYGTSSMSASFPSAEGLSPEARRKAAMMALTGTGLPVGRLTAGALALKNLTKAAPAVSRVASKAGLWTPGFRGADRAGQVIVGQIGGKNVSRIAKRPGEFAWRGRPTGLGYTVAGTAAGAPLLVDQLKDNGVNIDAFAGPGEQYVDTETGFTSPYEDFSGIPMTQAVSETVGNQTSDPSNYVPKEEQTATEVEEQNAPTEGSNLELTQNSIQSTGGQSNPEKFKILQSMYGKYSRDPAARKKQYLDQLNKIYTNAMILNGIAQLTGGRSQANAYIQMATGKMDAIEKFDSEERMQAIWKDVFFNESGQFSPPPDWQSTYEAVIKLGGTPKEAEELASSMFKKPSSTDKTPGGVTTEQYMLWKKMTSQAQTPEEKADAEAYGRMVGAIRDDRTKITPNTAGNLITKIDMGEIPDNGMKDKLLKIINDALPDSAVEISTPQNQESSGYKEFQTEEQVQSALDNGQIKLGDIVLINGRRARVE